MASAKIVTKNPIITKKIENENFSRSSIYGSKRISAIEEVLPFRIKFTNIGIPGYGPNNVPGIGIQVIGYSNYIL